MSESLDELERIFLAFSDKTRIKLIGLIGDGEVSVNYLSESVGESQPKVSRHLAYLRTMGMVNTRRDGKWIFYSLSWPESEHGSRFFRATLSWIDSLSNGRNVPVQPKFNKRSTDAETIEIVASDDDIYDHTHMRSEEGELDVYLL